MVAGDGQSKPTVRGGDSHCLYSRASEPGGPAALFSLPRAFKKIEPLPKNQEIRDQCRIQKICILSIGRKVLSNVYTFPQN